MRAIIPAVLIMIGCIMLGGGLYLGRVVGGNSATIFLWVRYGDNYSVIRSYLWENWFYVVKGYGFDMPNEVKITAIWNIPKPKDVNLYNIENVIVDIYPENPAGKIWIPDRYATVNDWRDFTFNIGKLKHPEDYLNPTVNLWNFDMVLIGQYNTAEHKMSEPYAYYYWVQENLNKASYKFKYENESIIGVGLVMATTLPYPPCGFWLFSGYLGLKLEGKGLVKLYGYVIDENGNPIDMASVSCDYGVVYTDENGYYEINVPEGGLEVNYYKEGYTEQIMKVDVPDRDNYRVDVMLEKLMVPPEENVPEENVPEEHFTLDHKVDVKSRVLITLGLGAIIMGLISLMLTLTQKVKMGVRM
jgi:hypothetical protein